MSLPWPLCRHQPQALPRLRSRTSGFRFKLSSASVDTGKQRIAFDPMDAVGCYHLQPRRQIVGAAFVLRLAQSSGLWHLAHAATDPSTPFSAIAVLPPRLSCWRTEWLRYHIAVPSRPAAIPTHHPGGPARSLSPFVGAPDVSRNAFSGPTSPVLSNRACCVFPAAWKAHMLTWTIPFSVKASIAAVDTESADVRGRFREPSRLQLPRGGFFCCHQVDPPHCRY